MLRNLIFSYLIFLNSNSSSARLRRRVLVWRRGRGAPASPLRKTPCGYAEKRLRGAARSSAVRAHRVGGGNLRRHSVAASIPLLPAASPARTRTQRGPKHGKREQEEDEGEVRPEAERLQGVPGGISGDICPDSEYLPLHLSPRLNRRFKAEKQHANNVSTWVSWGRCLPCICVQREHILGRRAPFDAALSCHLPLTSTARCGRRGAALRPPRLRGAQWPSTIAATSGPPR